MITAQEGLRPLTFNPRHIQFGQRQQVNPVAARVRAVSLELPFKDDFSYSPVNAYPDQRFWADSLVYVNSGFAIKPPTTGVATFDGLNRHGYPYREIETNLNLSRHADTLTSQPINLFSTGTKTLVIGDSIGLMFFYQQKGLGENPEPGDSLMVDFYDPTDSVWNKSVWAMQGDMPGADTLFRRAYIKIDSSKYLHPEFRFRFRNKATIAGDFDHWHIDYVYLNSNLRFADTIFDDLTFGGMPSSMLKEYSAMPYYQYNGNEMTSSLVVPIRYNGPSTAYMEYAYEVYHGGAPVLNYQGNAGNLQPFHIAGYSKEGKHTNFKPDTLPVPTSGAFDFAVKHYLTRTQDANFEFSRDNDTLWQFQRFRNYFAYDDGGAEAGYYVNGAGSRIAVQFRINKTDTLLGAGIYFDPAGDVKAHGFRLAVWQDIQGVPATVHYSFTTVFTQKFLKTGNRELAEFMVEQPLVLNPGSYFIGLQQQADNVVIGFDRNYDSHQKIWYSASKDWRQSEFPGSLMFRPLMSGEKLPVGVTENAPALRALMFPNPASGQVTLRCEGPFYYTVTNLMGQQVTGGQASDQAQLDVSGFMEGLYIVAIRNSAQKQAVQKLIIRR